jgi:hypothetical protein
MVIGKIDGSDGNEGDWIASFSRSEQNIGFGFKTVVQDKNVFHHFTVV